MRATTVLGKSSMIPTVLSGGIIKSSLKRSHAIAKASASKFFDLTQDPEDVFENVYRAIIERVDGDGNADEERFVGTFRSMEEANAAVKAAFEVIYDADVENDCEIEDHGYGEIGLILPTNEDEDDEGETFQWHIMRKTVRRSRWFEQPINITERAQLVYTVIVAKHNYMWGCSRDPELKGNEVVGVFSNFVTADRAAQEFGEIMQATEQIERVEEEWEDDNTLNITIDYGLDLGRRACVKLSKEALR